MPSKTVRLVAELRQLIGESAFTRHSIGLFTASIALLLVAGLAALFMAKQATQADGWVRHTIDVQGGIRGLLIELLNAETGERGYVITGDDKFLEPFNQAMRSGQAAYDRLLQQTADNPPQHDRIRQLRPTIEALITKLQQNIALVRQSHRVEAETIIRSGLGKQQMDELRAALDEVFAEETRLLISRQASARTFRDWLLALIGLSAAGAVVIGALILRSILHYVHRLRREAELRQRMDETLRQSQKLEAVGQLTGGIAHDFNNLLMIISGNLDTMRRRISETATDIPARLKQPLEHAQEGARSAARLTRQLLAFARQQPLDPQPLDLNEVVSGLSELLRRTLGETINVETVLASGLWQTYADANQLENVLINLAINARDAMPNGGRLTIETSNTYLDEGYVAQIGDVAAGQYVLLSVTDTGTGISPTILERVFDPFFTTKAVGVGSGLGLAMVHGFVKQSGGHVRIYTEVGHGTAVKVYFPRLMQEEPVTVLPSAARERAGDLPHARPNETVLLVEDNDGVRNYTKAALEELGYRVLAAADAAQAISMLAEPDRIDILFTDVVLPGGTSGRELADEILRQRIGMAVLFTTGYTRNAIIRHGRLDPNTNLLSKPYTQNELARKIRQVFESARNE